MKIGELLVQANLATPEQVQCALDHQKANGGRLGSALVTLGYLRHEQIVGLLSRQYGIDRIELEGLEIDPALLKLIPVAIARKHRVLPLARVDKVLTLAMADPTNLLAVDEIAFMTGHRIETVAAAEAALAGAIERHYGPPTSPARPTVGEALVARGLTLDDLATIGLSEVDLDAMAEAETELDPPAEAEEEIDLDHLRRACDCPPVAKLTNVILVEALKRGASHIHIEPYEREYRVRFRIDGILHNVMALPPKLRDPLTTRIKAMARMNVAEKRLPQDGRIQLKLRIEDRSRDLGLRASSLPTPWGERIVLRVLGQASDLPCLAGLGLGPGALERVKRVMARRQGLVLVTGASGSGKTSTLVALAKMLHRPGVNVVAIHERFDYPLVGVNHLCLRPDLGLTAGAALQGALRQDPNVIVVDELEDAEASRVALRAAAHGGHRVLAAMSDTDPASALEELAEASGRTLLGRALNLVVAQRLVRRICPHCRIEVDDVPPPTLIEMGLAPDLAESLQLFEGEGCNVCLGTGYKGRVGLYEVMEISEDIGDFIRNGATGSQIRRKAIEEGMATLRMSGIEKIQDGVTTFEEVLHATSLGSPA